MEPISDPALPEERRHSMPTGPHSPLLGRRYRLLDLLGKGGMGEVYRATDEKLGREVAIKVLHTQIEDEKALKRFEREGDLVGELDCPGIARLLDKGFVEKLPYLVFELVDGLSLDKRVRHGAIPLLESLEIVIGVATALEIAHQKGIIHRDLKPANIVLTADGPRLLDFGIASLPHQKVEDRLTAAGALVGTPSYMSPEYLGTGKVLPALDIWSLGAILFECLTGRGPFSRPTISETVLAVLKEDVPDLHEILPEAPERLCALVRESLQKTVGARITNASAFRARAEEVLAGLMNPDVVPGTQELRTALTLDSLPPVPGSSVSRSTEQTIAVAAEDPARARRSGPSRPSGRSGPSTAPVDAPGSSPGRWMAAVAAAFLVAGLAVAGLRRSPAALAPTPAPPSPEASAFSAGDPSAPPELIAAREALDARVEPIRGSRDRSLLQYLEDLEKGLPPKLSREDRAARWKRLVRAEGEGILGGLTPHATALAATPTLEILDDLELLRALMAEAQNGPGQDPRRVFFEDLMGSYGSLEGPSAGPVGPVAVESAALVLYRDRGRRAISHNAVTDGPLRPGEAPWRWRVPRLLPPAKGAPEGSMLLELLTQKMTRGFLIEVTVGGRYRIHFVGGVDPHRIVDRFLGKRPTWGEPLKEVEQIEKGHQSFQRRIPREAFAKDGDTWIELRLHRTPLDTTPDGGLLFGRKEPLLYNAFLVD